MTKFSEVTEQGYAIISKVVDRFNDLHVIVKRPRGDYAIGLGYNEENGCWRQGRYDFNSLEQATAVLIEEKFNDTKLERYKTLCGNAVIMLEDAGNEHKEILQDLSMTEEEYKELNI